MSTPSTALSTPYRTLAEAAVILRYRGVHAKESARQFLRDQGVPFYRRGRRMVLVHVDDIHEVVTTGQCVRGLARRQQELSEPARALRAVSGGRR